MRDATGEPSCMCTVPKREYISEENSKSGSRKLYTGLLHIMINAYFVQQATYLWD